MNNYINISLPEIKCDIDIIKQLSDLYELTNNSKYHQQSNYFIFKYNQKLTTYTISFSLHSKEPQQYPPVNLDCSFISHYNPDTFLVYTMIHTILKCIQQDTELNLFYTHICVTVLIHLIESQSSNIIQEYNKQYIYLLKQIYENCLLYKQFKKDCKSPHILSQMLNILKECLQLIEKKVSYTDNII